MTSFILTHGWLELRTIELSKATLFTLPLAITPLFTGRQNSNIGNLKLVELSGPFCSRSDFGGLFETLKWANQNISSRILDKYLGAAL